MEIICKSMGKGGLQEVQMLSGINVVGINSLTAMFLVLMAQRMAQHTSKQSIWSKRTMRDTGASLLLSGQDQKVLTQAAWAPLLACAGHCPGPSQRHVPWLQLLTDVKLCSPHPLGPRVHLYNESPCPPHASRSIFKPPRRSGRGTAGSVLDENGPKWWKTTISAKMTYSELIFVFTRLNGQTWSILVHFGLERPILVHLGPLTVLWPLWN